jgi:hypothetical protein
MTPNIEYIRPPIDRELLEMLIDRVYAIVPLSKGIADKNCTEQLRKDCLEQIYDITVVLGKTLMLIEGDVKRMDAQIVNLLGHINRQGKASLN